jgi:hypothetical protein
MNAEVRLPGGVIEHKKQKINVIFYKKRESNEKSMFLQYQCLANNKSITMAYNDYA